MCKGFVVDDASAAVNVILLGVRPMLLKLLLVKMCSCCCCWCSCLSVGVAVLGCEAPGAGEALLPLPLLAVAHHAVAVAGRGQPTARHPAGYKRSGRYMGLSAFLWNGG